MSEIISMSYADWKPRTKDEVLQFVRDTWPKAERYTDTPYSATEVADGRVTFVVKQMYEFVECGFKELCAIAMFFGTSDVSDERDSWGGCETCDWGSSYEIRFTAKRMEVRS